MRNQYQQITAFSSGEVLLPIRFICFVLHGTIVSRSFEQFTFLAVALKLYALTFSPRIINLFLRRFFRNKHLRNVVILAWLLLVMERKSFKIIASLFFSLGRTCKLSSFSFPRGELHAGGHVPVSDASLQLG